MDLFAEAFDSQLEANPSEADAALRELRCDPAGAAAALKDAGLNAAVSLTVVASLIPLTSFYSLARRAVFAQLPLLLAAAALAAAFAGQRSFAGNMVLRLGDAHGDLLTLVKRNFDAGRLVATSSSKAVRKAVFKSMACSATGASSLHGLPPRARRGRPLRAPCAPRAGRGRGGGGRGSRSSLRSGNAIQSLLRRRCNGQDEQRRR